MGEAADLLPVTRTDAGHILDLLARRDTFAYFGDGKVTELDATQRVQRAAVLAGVKIETEVHTYGVQGVVVARVKSGRSERT